MSTLEGQVVGSVNAYTINARTAYKLNGAPLGLSALTNDTGYVTAAQVQADWQQTDPTNPQYISNKPALVNIATTGSANDILSGIVPVGSIPQLPAQQISSGNFQVGSFAVNVVPTVSGSQNLGSAALQWGTVAAQALAINKGTTSIQLDVAGQGAMSGNNPQLALVNPSTTANGQTPAEVLFDRTATGASQIGSVGLDATRGLYARVNGQDRLNIDTSGNIAISGTLTGLSVNTHQLGKFKISSFGNGTGSDFTGFGHGDVTGAGAAAMLARSDGTVYINSGSGSGPRIILENLGSSLIGMDSSGNLSPFTDGGQNLGSITAGLRWGLLNVVNVNCTGTLTYQGSALAAIATSGSASDLVTGVAPLARIPNLPANRITSGTFLFDGGASVLFSSNASPSSNGGASLGSATAQWASIFGQNIVASQGITCAQNITANGNITAVDASGALSVGTGIVKATTYDSNFANTSHTFGAVAEGAGITGTDASNLDSTRAQWRHRGATQNATPVTAAFALQHTATGATTLNALSGQSITLANNNSPQVTIGLGSILPASTLQIGLGSSALRFLDCYARNMNLSGAASMVNPLIVTATSSGATVARFNGVGGSGNVSNIDFSSFSDGSSPSWRWTQTDAGNNQATLKLQRTIGGGNSAAMTDVITYNTDSTVTFANQIRTPSIANLTNTSYFDGKVSQLVNDSGSLSPAGVIVSFAGGSSPTGWLLCDGTAYSRTTYGKLYAVLGTTYGSGDGSSTFNVPDMRSRVPVCYDSSSQNFSALNAKGGELAHTLSVSELPSHGHGINDPSHNHTIVDNGHSHTYSGGTQKYSGQGSGQTAINGLGGQGSGTIETATTSSSGSNFALQNSTTGISIQNTGSGAAHNVLQPYITLYFIIKF